MKTEVIMNGTMDGVFNDSTILGRVKGLSYDELKKLSLDQSLSTDEWFIVLDEMSNILDSQNSSSDESSTDPIKTMSLECAISQIVSNCPSSLIPLLLSRFESSGQGDNISEKRFFNTFQEVAGIELHRQYIAGKYRIDAVFIEDRDNDGEYDAEKDIVRVITCFEFDEAYHATNRQIEKDIIRHAKIIWELKDTFDYVEFYRIPEANQFDFLRLAIPYYSSIETAYTWDRLRDYSFAVDMGRITSFGQLMEEMRNIYHAKNNKF